MAEKSEARKWWGNDLSLNEQKKYAKKHLHNFEYSELMGSTSQYSNLNRFEKFINKIWEGEGKPKSVLKGLYKNGGSVDEVKKQMLSNGLNSVEVIFKNPEYNYRTSLSPQSTEESARDYFVGKTFDVGIYPKEQMEEVIDIKFFKNPNKMEKGGSVKKGSSSDITKTINDKSGVVKNKVKNSYTPKSKKINNWFSGGLSFLNY